MMLLIYLITLMGIVLNTMATHLTDRNYYYTPQELPEIIINRGANYIQGYNYPVPNPPPPPHFDEPLPSTLLPPLDYLPINDPLPPENITNSYLPPGDVYGVPRAQMKVLKMSCSDSARGGKFFRAAIEASGFPVVDGASGERCLFRVGQRFEVSVEGGRMEECGVARCGEKKLCLPMRIAVVRGLKLPEDSVVNLECRTQSSVVGQTRHLAVKISHLEGRNSGTIASGGSQRDFESRVALYKKSPSTGDFSLIVQPGSSVFLGEELLIKAVIRDGDGWIASRMGSVVMRTSGTGKSVQLVDDSGCRLQSMRIVCPEQPKKTSPLTASLTLRAFMFDGANQGDEMVLSVRMYGCVQPDDCLQPDHCGQNGLEGVRGKRDAGNQTEIKGATTDWESYVDFRVILPQDNNKNEDRDVFNITCYFSILAMASVVIAFSFKCFKNIIK